AGRCGGVGIRLFRRPDHAPVAAGIAALRRRPTALGRHDAGKGRKGRRAIPDFRQAGLTSRRVSVLRPLSIWVTGEPVPQAAARAGSFADMIRARTGAAWRGAWSVVDVTDTRTLLPQPNEVSGVIVTGSPARIADQLPWMRRVQDALAQLVEADVPCSVSASAISSSAWRSAGVQDRIRGAGRSVR